MKYDCNFFDVEFVVFSNTIISGNHNKMRIHDILGLIEVIKLVYFLIGFPIIRSQFEFNGNVVCFKIIDNFNFVYFDSLCWR